MNELLLSCYDFHQWLSNLQGITFSDFIATPNSAPLIGNLPFSHDGYATNFFQNKWTCSEFSQYVVNDVTLVAVAVATSTVRKIHGTIPRNNLEQFGGTILQAGNNVAGKNKKKYIF